MKEIRKSGVTRGKVDVLHLDLGYFNSVREFAYKTLSKVDQIDILINNGMLNVLAGEKGKS